MKMYGPYSRKDGRKHVIIIDDEGKRTTKSWPRVLMEKHLERELSSEETVDHIDNDFRNDSIENLQILSLRENVSKQHEKIRESVYIRLQCKYCGLAFEKRKALEIYDRQVRKKDGPFCSKSCVGKIHH